MRNYWLKIVLGALGIFAAGMVAVTGFRQLKVSVNRTINSSDPIPIPLIGLIPFRLDDQKLGSLSRVEFLRSDPEHVSGVRVVVKLADSVSPDRLRSCGLALEDLNDLPNHTTFSCQAPGAPTAGLEPFGTVVLGDGADSFQLFLPAKAVADLRDSRFHADASGFHVSSPGDPMGEAMEARRDSLDEVLDARIEARSDSIDELKDLASELEDSATDLGRSQRRQVQHSADSVRAVMRGMVDRMKSDAARQAALATAAGLSAAEVDSLSRSATALGDSIRQAVFRDLARTRVELERARPRAAATIGSPPEPPDLPAAPHPPTPPAARP